MGKNLPPAERMRVGFFPGDSRANRWGREIHPWSALATGALEEQGCEIQFLNKDELTTLPPRPDLDVVHLNWPQSLANPESHKRRKYLPRGLYKRWFIGQVERWMEALQALEIPVVWQVHDLPYAADPDMLELLEFVFSRVFERADGLLFYEASAQEPVFELLGSPGSKAVGIAHLGSYTEMHGPAVPRDVARERLGISSAHKVFLYAGTVRWTRSPQQFLESFHALSGPDDILIVTGRGTEKLASEYSRPNTIFKPGMVAHDDFRDMVCACDFVINDAYRYLGSAIIRVALGYGVPVIARSFGCTSDIARGAYIEVAESEGGLEDAVQRALSLTAAEHQTMSKAAMERHQERPWSAYGEGCLDVYRRLIAKSTLARRDVRTPQV